MSLTSADTDRIVERRHDEFMEWELKWRWLLDSYEGGERYRNAVADNRKGPKFADAVTALRKAKYSVDSRESLKRVPRGFDADHPRAELLKLKGIHVGREFGTPRWVHTKTAATKITETWKAADPVNTWLNKHVGPSEIAPPEPD